ncbi:hypothetical protein AB0L40_03970, partial [Patulibacter sp. NPDC049589]|uniref:hypothetical protein n=1 Tax=Patulibacter sp. NPDC049589 TaxID=3154731 RepID=UPI00341E5A31
MDPRVSSYLDHARRVLATGRRDDAAGLERQALLIVEQLPDGREERAAVLTLRATRLNASADYAGALAATLEALALTVDPAAATTLRLEEGRLRLATDAGAGRPGRPPGGRARRGPARRTRSRRRTGGR